MSHTGHNRRSIRLSGHDYCQPGAYFVTLVAYEREPLFGTVVDGIERLNGCGEVVTAAWTRLESLFPVRIDSWVLMPNHFHGILWLLDYLCRGEAAGTNQPGENDGVAPAASPLQPDAPRFVGTRSGSLAAIVQNFKSVTTIRINRLRQTPGCHVWQRNYYDHIIRSKGDLDRVRRYVTENPSHWDADGENPSVGR